VNSVAAELIGRISCERGSTKKAIAWCTGSQHHFPVNASLPLDQMSTEEKLAAMEAIWSDLSRHEQQLPTPYWHKRVLDQRQRQIDRGEATFIDWEKAKRRIRARTG
jgi:hypothetical protein